MAWNPQFNAVDIRALVGNLVSFFEEYQVAALAWVSPSRTLAPLTCYQTAESRVRTDFPHVGVVDRSTRVEDGDSLKIVTFQCKLEFEVETTHTKEERSAALAQLAADVEAVKIAYESMALNIAPEALYGDGRFETARSVVGGNLIEAAVSDTRSMFNAQLELMFQFAWPSA